MNETRKRLFLTQKQSPGDVLMLTAAVRDLVRQHSDKYAVNVETTAQELWDNNPYLDRDITQANADLVLKAEYPIVDHINGRPWHFIHGFRLFLEDKLGVQIQQGFFKGDIHLHEAEKHLVMSQVQSIIGTDTPYWLLNAGVKDDYTNKGWEFARFQQVVDRLRGHVLFVQVGERGHGHPNLSGVLDLRGRTTTRDLIRLVYHSSGALTPVSFLMHLAAAVPTRTTKCLKSRPCVVIAGGREPPQWEAYPWHQFLHTCGTMDCCAVGGCWKSRIVELPVHPEHNTSLCVKPVKSESGQMIPMCMDMITVEDVLRSIGLYLEGYHNSGLDTDDRSNLVRFLDKHPEFGPDPTGMPDNACAWFKRLKA
jgi:ADP-heptose:LPS heptosyltransferase